MVPFVLTADESEEQLARGSAGVGALQVAAVYAEALLNAAEKAGQVDQVVGELDALLDTTVKRGSPLRPFFASGVISRETRGEVIRKVFENNANPLIIDFLMVLNEHDRLALLPVIIFELKHLRDRRARKMPVYLSSAAPLTEDQLDQVRQAVRRNLNLEPMLETKIDPDLLGGLVFRVGDWIFDGSVQSKLTELSKQISENSSHEIQSGRDRFRSADGN
jgi:F-type H+-transporting ATPase subunit delta